MTSLYSQFNQYQPKTYIQKYLKTLFEKRNSITHDFEHLEDMLSIKDYLEFMFASNLKDRADNFFPKPEHTPSNISDEDYFYSAISYIYFHGACSIYHKIVDEGLPLFLKKEDGVILLSEIDEPYLELIKYLSQNLIYDKHYYNINQSDDDHIFLKHKEYSLISFSQQHIKSLKIFFGEFEGGDIEKEIRKSAFKLYIEGKLTPRNKDIIKAEQPKEIKLSSKTKNAYLKTIYALSEALVEGLTGAKNKDAGAVIAALSAKGIDPPIGEKALGNYLDEAKELIKQQ